METLLSYQERIGFYKSFPPVTLRLPFAMAQSSLYAAFRGIDFAFADKAIANSMMLAFGIEFLIAVCNQMTPDEGAAISIFIGKSRVDKPSVCP